VLRTYRLPLVVIDYRENLTEPTKQVSPAFFLAEKTYNSTLTVPPCRLSLRSGLLTAIKKKFLAEISHIFANAKTLEVTSFRSSPLGFLIAMFISIIFEPLKVVNLKK
jgi:hypothetical protein